jgi:L-alanine-DL-glutamate epimerase-like enolase superfamily enzyme
MKIVNITLTQLELPLQEPGLRPGWLGGTKYYSTYPVQLLRINTDEDITGIALSERTSLSALNYTKHILIDKEIDPFEIEKFSQTYIMPASIENALLDIAGKVIKKPIYKMLGGFKDKVKAYAATINLKEPKERSKDAIQFLEKGFKAIKLRAHFPDPMKDLAVVKAVREAVGNDMEIMVDANQASHKVPPIWSHRTVYKMAKAFEKLGVYWLEEPLHKDDLSGTSELSEKMVSLMIAGAEGETSLRRFNILFKNRCFDIIQPETIWAGIYNVKKIAILAESYSKLIVPHTHSICGLGLASSLQLIGSIPNCPYVEFGFEPPIITEEHRDRILKNPIKIDKNGYVRIPNKPGLGVELNEEYVEQCTVSKYI